MIVQNLITNNFTALVQLLIHAMAMHLERAALGLLLLLALAYSAEGKEYPIAKPNCTDSCGNVSIPYPFGIEAGCYHNQSFQISCSNRRPTLTKLQMEVLEIRNTYMPREHFLRVKSPVIAQGCSGNRTHQAVDFARTPFAYISGQNEFTAIGCGRRAILAGIDPDIVGCQLSPCYNMTSLATNNTCSGNGCCRTVIPSALQVFDVGFERTRNDVNTTTSRCTVAFIADKQWFDYNVTDPFALQSWDTVEATLHWVFPEHQIYTGQYLDDFSIYCQAFISQSSAYLNGTKQCFCTRGFDGNPYLPKGCQDIDECEDPSRRSGYYQCHGKKCVNTPGSYECESKKTWPIILGLSLGIGLLCLPIGGWWMYKWLKRRREVKLKEKFFKQNGGLLLQQQLSSSEGNVEKTRLFTSKDLERATDNFNKNRILGQGGQGTVYKGMLDDGRIVAVKKAKVVDEAQLEGFINEVVILSQINHRNVVKLLGCCLETQVPLLVYEYIPNGTLYQYIHEENEEFPLTWEIRLRIASEVAAAVAYLHSAASVPIYHRDIKSTNILLDEKYRAKVSDFGTSRTIAIDQTHLTTHVQGTFGYLDPEYFQSSQFTEKSDVYSFGVVLVELLTREKPISSTRVQEGRSLATHFILSMEENKLFSILDPELRENAEIDNIVAMARLANKCLNLSGRKRPNMKETAIELARISQMHKEIKTPQHHEEINILDGQTRDSWDAASLSTFSGFDTGTSLSLDIDPLISNRSN